MRQELIWRGMQVIKNMERETGLEPATSSLGSWHSTTELLPLNSHRLLASLPLFYAANGLAINRHAQQTSDSVRWLAVGGSPLIWNGFRDSGEPTRVVNGLG